MSVPAADARIRVTVSIGVAVLGQPVMTCSSCSPRPTWRCTRPRTPAAIRCGCTPTPRARSRPQRPKRRRGRNGTRQQTGTRRLDFMPEFIYQMGAVRKAHGDKVILDDVTLAFLPGA